MYQGLKHSTATDLKRRGVDDRVLQKFLGHRDPRSVEHYARLSDQALVDVIGLRAGPGDVGGRVRRRQGSDGGGGPDES